MQNFEFSFIFLVFLLINELNNIFYICSFYIHIKIKILSNHPLTMNFIQHIIYTMEDENFNAKVQGKETSFYTNIFKEGQTKLRPLSTQFWNFKTLRRTVIVLRSIVIAETDHS